MKKNYFVLKYAFIALLLIFASCSKDEENEQMNESAEAVAELDFVKNDGTEGLPKEEAFEADEEAPILEEGAKSYWNYDYTLLKPSDLTPDQVKAKACGESKTMPLLVGSRKLKVGKVVVSNDEENLYLTFRANKSRYMKKVYLYIGEKGQIPFYSNGFPNLRKFNFKAFPYYFGGMKKATYVIPLSSINLDCFEIVAYSKVYDKNSSCFYSAFAYNKNLTQEYTYSYYSGCYYYGEWVRSFEYCVEKCQAECVQAYGYHEQCGICENDVLNTFFAYTFLDSRGPDGFNIELITNTNGCDISTSTEVGHINIKALEGSRYQISYEVNAGYEMCELNFSYGSSRFDTPNTVSEQFDTPTTSYSFEIDRLPAGANIYINSGAQIAESN